MKVYYKILLSVGIIFLTGAVGFLLMSQGVKNIVNADAGDNVLGWAWSENIGWISFNCANPELPAPRCIGANNYGVNIDPVTGLFSGRAYSEHIGYITFNSQAPNDELRGCPVNPCEARLDTNNGQISGWARALTPLGADARASQPGDDNPQRGGWDGWIKLRGAAQNGAVYGVFYDDSFPANPRLSGWAWGGDDINSEAVIGWISFNAGNPEIPAPMPPGPPFPMPPGPPYAPIPPVIPITLPNNNPIILSASSQQGDYCANPAALQVFAWNYNDPDSDPQVFYQIQVDWNGNWIADQNGEFDTGKLGSGTSSVTYPIIWPDPAPNLNQLAYNKNYQWRIKVWDSRGGESAWLGPMNFNDQVPVHKYPQPNFNWSPFRPVEAEIAQFCGFLGAPACPVVLSKCYNNLNAQTPCQGNIWSAQFGGINCFGLNCNFEPGDNINTKNPQITFSERGFYNVSLLVRDAQNYQCSKTQIVQVNMPLPGWKEISP